MTDITELTAHIDSLRVDIAEFMTEIQGMRAEETQGIKKNYQILNQGLTKLPPYLKDFTDGNHSTILD